MFIKHPNNPIIQREQESFYSIHVANPDLLEFDDEIFMCFRGQGNELHDQIGIDHVKSQEFDGVNFQFYENNPIIKVSDNKTDFDCNHILDPAAIIFRNNVFLYYSGHSLDKSPGIGLAISKNGFDFKKTGQVIENAIAPKVVFKDGLVHLFYQRKNGKHFEFYKCTSVDGVNFDKENEVVIFKPSHKDGEFDSFSITTCRIFKEANTYFMTYGACQKFSDYPESFCLARSLDLVLWDRFPDNPILHRGNTGEWDEGAIWFPTIYKHNDKYYMWYEGSGAGLGVESEEAIEASDICRNNDYGGYADINFSQIGLAEYTGIFPNW
ncbi:MAG: hypothetical protein KAH14_04830 [Clostridiales bacterium]|nr:hypothetical protein [Clostridiales bacterium]